MSENTTSHQPTLFAADSLASLTVTLGSEEARQMTATSGRSILELLMRSNRDMSLVKMFLDSLPPCSTKFYLTWRAITTPQRRLLFQLVPSTPLTDEIGFSSLLNIPTPTAADHYKGNLKSSQTKEGSMHSVTLPQLISMLPTPRAGNPGSRPNGKGGKILNEEIGKATGLKLQPAFVEWMMGFPIGWTDLDHSETP